MHSYPRNFFSFGECTTCSLETASVTTEDRWSPRGVRGGWLWRNVGLWRDVRPAHFQRRGRLALLPWPVSFVLRSPLTTLSLNLWPSTP